MNSCGMIKREDVRIGILLQQASGIPFIVTQKDLTNPFFWEELNKAIKPLPITQEALIKAGFEQSYTFKLTGSNFILYYEDGEFTMTYGAYCEEANKVAIEHVHNLQNLYLLLEGEELPIIEVYGITHKG
jgi:hypothetical protein